jgi:signal transduction histidine kinase
MIPVILITGQPQETTVRESMSLGADDYLAKPFAVADLLDTVRARIAKSELVRRLAEQKLEALRANLRTSLPHELLTPLTGIIAGAEIIRSDYRALGPEEVTRFADMIAQSARRLLKLVHNYIEYAELEILAADPGQLETLRRQLIAFSKELIAKAAGEKARQYDRTLDLDLRLCESPAGVGDQALREIVDQLVDNAFKFSEPGEGVTVESVREGAELVLRVRDRGSGMTPEQIAIVGAGVQFDRTRREQQGLGLGLALVRRLVEVHGGTCRIRSEPKVFTEVEVRLRTSV